MIPAAAYIRVSTGHQVDQGSSLPSQEAAIREYAERNGYEILPDHIYSDEGESARTADRPDFQRMMAIAKQPRPPFEAIICYESSRFARSREDAIIYKSLLRRRGIALRFAKQDFDDSIGGRLLEGIIEVIDEWYSLNLSVETLRGQKQTAEQGFATGGKPPYGLHAVKTTNQFGKQKTRWEPDPETAPIVRQICEERVAGKGLKLLAYELNERGVKAPRGGAWTHNTLYYLLSKNIDAYRGTLIFNREDGEFTIQVQPV